MNKILRAKRMEHVHSDIRGPLFVEAMNMQAKGIDVLKLNTGNPATFGFKQPKSIEDALEHHTADGVGYCDFRGCRSPVKRLAHITDQKESKA